MNTYVTVILPLKYYYREFLFKAIQSIINQSSSNWNLLIVVEPEDRIHFQELLKTQLEDSRVELIISERKGFPGKINTGMNVATTQYVSILLGDDMWAKDTIQVLNGYIKKFPHIDFFHSSRVIIDEKDKHISPVYRSKENFTLNDFKMGSPVKHLLCWRREKGIAIGGVDESIGLTGPDDYDFPWVMVEQGASFKAVPECLYLYRNHCECSRLTSHQPLSTSKKGTRGILKKHGVGFFERTMIIAKKRRYKALGAQCVYRNPLDKWVKEKFNYDPKRSWKQSIYK